MRHKPKNEGMNETFNERYTIILPLRGTHFVYKNISIGQGHLLYQLFMAHETTPDIENRVYCHTLKIYAKSGN